MPTYQSDIPIVFDILLASEEFIPSMKKRFPYSITFASSNLQVFSPNQDDIFLANASIDKLESYLNSEGIDLEKNYDLLGVAFNAFVVNRVNKNDQVISTDDALACVENFKFKPLNIEHDREKIVGLITGFGFSEFGTDKILTEEDVKASNDPFNVVLKGFVWKIANKDFSSRLESSADPSSPDYLSISTSWELGFKEFRAVKGSKNLFECEEVAIETMDEAKSMLRHFGGSGKDENGNEIYLQIVGEVLPLGVGFTVNPAAEVKGVLVASEADLQKNSEKDEKNPNVSASCEESISHLEKKDVLKNIKQRKLLAMLIKNIEDINEETLPEIKASDVSEFIESELKKSSEQWVKEKAEAEIVAEGVKKENEALKAEIELARKESEEAKSELEKVKAELQAKQIEDEFQLRMASLDEDYFLTEEDRELIASQINGMDEEAFSTWIKSFSVFAKEKSKKNKAEFFKKLEEKKDGEDEKEKEEKKKSEASASETVLDELKEKKEVQIPNNGVEPKKESFRQLFAKAFNKNSVKVTTGDK